MQSDETLHLPTKSGAGPDLLADEVANLLRLLMRSIASHDPDANVYDILNRIRQIRELAKSCDNPDMVSVLSAALRDVSTVRQDVGLSESTVEAAKQGMMLLAHGSASDNFARARTSKQHIAFLGAIDRL